jgi:transcriptional regulator of heat shock response
MVRLVDYETRRRAILTAAINRYIKDAAPVSSLDIAAEFDLSPATIRNIFAELEEGGYLTHPHTSAGRVPTDKGYRYYVDLLSSRLELLEDEKNSITRYYEQQINRLEEILERTSQVISSVTHYTSIVSFLEWHDRFFYNGVSFVLDQPEFQDIRRMRYLIRIIEDKARLLDILNRDFKEKVRVYIGQELGCAEMDNCALAVATYSLNNKPLGRMAVLGPSRMEYRHIIPALEYVSDILSDTLNKI